MSLSDKASAESEYDAFLTTGSFARTVLLLPIGLLILIGQYSALFYAVTNGQAQPLCKPQNFEQAWRGWYLGICYTDEQLWCWKHGGRHADCLTANCRAEEIRLTLFMLHHAMALPPTPIPVYSDCMYSIYQRIQTQQAASSPWDNCAVCVPSNDKRANFLPHCSAQQASCRSPYYVPANRSIADWRCDDPSLFNQPSGFQCISPLHARWNSMVLPDIDAPSWIGSLA